jgi:predicted RNA-binding protein with PUA-like domain
VAYWLLKTDPEEYSWDTFVQDRRTLWDGVTNPLAQKHLRSMRPGDELVIYETGEVRAARGLARVLGLPEPDPADPTGKRVVVPVEVSEELPRPIPLSALKNDPIFSDSPVVRQGRLSVVPLTPAQWDRILWLSRG